MAKRVRWLYEQHDGPDGSLERSGSISEAALRAWEYRIQPQREWQFRNGPFADTVRVWRTERPDLRQPEQLLVGDFEELMP